MTKVLGTHTQVDFSVCKECYNVVHVQVLSRSKPSILTLHARLVHSRFQFTFDATIGASSTKLTWKCTAAVHVKTALIHCVIISNIDGNIPCNPKFLPTLVGRNLGLTWKCLTPKLASLGGDNSIVCSL